VHAIRWRASDVFETILCMPNVNRRLQGQGIGFRTVIVFGGDDLNLRDIFQGLVQGDNARRLVTIVIGNQNSHAYPGKNVIVGAARVDLAQPFQY
jgi:hypothetical protein